MPSLIDERVGDEYDGHCLYVGRCWSLMCTCVLYLICFLFGQLAFIHRKGELQILLLLCWWFANDIFDSNGPRKVTNACKIHYNYHLISDEYFLIWNPAILLLTVGLAQNISNIIVYLRCHCSYNEVSHIKSTINSWTGFVFQKSPLVHGVEQLKINIKTFHPMSLVNLASTILDKNNLLFDNKRII